MSYLHEYQKFRLQEQIIEQEMTLSYLSEEASFMLTCLESGSLIYAERPDELVLEAVVKKVAGAGVSLFKRIIEFIKGILKKFAEKVGILAKSNEQWIKDNQETLSKAKDKGIEIEMTAYWKNMKRLNEVIDILHNAKFVSVTTGNLKDNEASQYNTVEKIKDKFFGRYLDSNGKLGKGIQNMVRTGSPTTEESKVRISGDDLTRLINNTFIPYIQSYKTSTLPSYQKTVADITKMAENADRILQTKESDTTSATEELKESFCLLENTVYGLTELSYVLNIPVMEAIERVESQKQIDNANNTSSPAKVEVKKSGTEAQQNQTRALREVSRARVQAAKNGLTVAQTILTTAMTLSEEINIAYMNALKSIAGEVSTKEKESEKTTVNNAISTVQANDI